jgi:tRNA 2-thiouridine synthesizing protein A
VKSWDYEIDATELNCPMPLLKMKQALNSANVGEVVMIKVTDSASQRDFNAFIEMTEHELEMEIQSGLFLYWITKH